MTDVDELDRIWTDGLSSAAETIVVPPDPGARVAGRVRHRRRVRRARVGVAVGALVVVVTVGVVAVSRPDRVAVVAPGPTVPPAPVPRAVVRIIDAPGGALKFTIPGRDLGNPPSLTLPAGLIRFVIHGNAPGHDLRIEGVPYFEANFGAGAAMVATQVQLAPGDYVLYCAIPGHRAAGEELPIHVVP
jgi:hypothetical protein